MHRLVKMDFEYFFCQVCGNTIKIPIGLGRPSFANFNDFEKWHASEKNQVNILMVKLEHGEILESDVEKQMISWSKKQIALLKKRERSLKTLKKIESRLKELDEEILSSLKDDKKQCLELLKELEELNLNTVILKKNPSIINTIAQVIDYQGVKPKPCTRQRSTIVSQELEEVKKQGHNIIRKFITMFNVPNERSFFDVFEEKKELFYQETMYMTDGEKLLLSIE